MNTTKEEELKALVWSGKKLKAMRILIDDGMSIQQAHEIIGKYSKKMVISVIAEAEALRERLAGRDVEIVNKLIELVSKSNLI